MWHFLHLQLLARLLCPNKIALSSKISLRMQQFSTKRGVWEKPSMAFLCINCAFCGVSLHFTSMMRCAWSQVYLRFGWHPSSEHADQFIGYQRFGHDRSVDRSLLDQTTLRGLSLNNPFWWMFLWSSFHVCTWQNVRTSAQKGKGNLSQSWAHIVLGQQQTELKKRKLLSKSHPENQHKIK